MVDWLSSWFVRWLIFLRVGCLNTILAGCLVVRCKVGCKYVCVCVCLNWLVDGLAGLLVVSVGI